MWEQQQQQQQQQHQLLYEAVTIQRLTPSVLQSCSGDKVLVPTALELKWSVSETELQSAVLKRLTPLYIGAEQRTYYWANRLYRVMPHNI